MKIMTKGDEKTKLLAVFAAVIVIAIAIFLVDNNITGEVTESSEVVELQQTSRNYDLSALGEIYLFPDNVSVTSGSNVQIGIYIDTTLTNVLGITLDLDGVSSCTFQSNLGNDFYAVLSIIDRVAIVTKDTSISIPSNMIDGTNPIAYLDCLVNAGFEITQNGVSKIVWRDSGINYEKDAVFTGSEFFIVPVPVCGNNVIETGEKCDDGNTNNGDGCSSSCQTEGTTGGGGGGGGGRSAPAQEIVIEPIVPEIMRARQEVVINVNIDASSLENICPKGDKLIVEIENLNIPVTNVDIDVSLENKEIEINPYFKTPVALSWYEKDNGIFITGAVPTDSELFNTKLLENKKSFDLGEKETVEAGFALSPSIIGIDGELRVTVTRDNELIKEEVRVLDIPNPDAAIIVEQEGNNIKLFTYVNQKSDVEVAFNKKGVKPRGPGFLGLWDSLFRATSSRFVDLQEDLEPGLYGQQFSKVIDIDGISGHVINIETEEKVGVVKCFDGVCEFPYSYLKELCDREVIFSDVPVIDGVGEVIIEVGPGQKVTEDMYKEYLDKGFTVVEKSDTRVKLVPISDDVEEVIIEVKPGDKVTEGMYREYLAKGFVVVEKTDTKVKLVKKTEETALGEVIIEIGAGHKVTEDMYKEYLDKGYIVVEKSDTRVKLVPVIDGAGKVVIKTEPGNKVTEDMYKEYLDKGFVVVEKTDTRVILLPGKKKLTTEAKTEPIPPVEEAPEPPVEKPEPPVEKEEKKVRKILIIIPGEPTVSGDKDLMTVSHAKSIELAKKYFRDRGGKEEDIYDLGENGYENVDKKAKNILEEIEKRGKIICENETEIIVFVIMHGSTFLDTNEWFGQLMKGDYEELKGLSERLEEKFLISLVSLNYLPKSSLVIPSQKILEWIEDVEEAIDDMIFSQYELDELISKLVFDGEHGSCSVYLAVEACSSAAILSSESAMMANRTFVSTLSPKTCSFATYEGLSLPFALFSDSTISLNDITEKMLSDKVTALGPVLKSWMASSYDIEEITLDKMIEFISKETNLTKEELEDEDLKSFLKEEAEKELENIEKVVNELVEGARPRIKEGLPCDCEEEKESFMKKLLEYLFGPNYASEETVAEEIGPEDVAQAEQTTKEGEIDTKSEKQKILEKIYEKANLEGPVEDLSKENITELWKLAEKDAEFSYLLATYNILRPKKYALIILGELSKDPEDVIIMNKDVEHIEKYLAKEEYDLIFRTYYFKYDEVNKRASKELDIENSFKDIRQNFENAYTGLKNLDKYPQDTVLIYFTGHGQKYSFNEWIGHLKSTSELEELETLYRDYEHERFRFEYSQEAFDITAKIKSNENTLSQEEIYNKIKEGVACKDGKGSCKVIVIIDSCFSGSFLTSGIYQINKIIGVVRVITSAPSYCYSYSAPGYGSYLLISFDNLLTKVTDILDITQGELKEEVLSVSDIICYKSHYEKALAEKLSPAKAHAKAIEEAKNCQEGAHEQLPQIGIGPGCEGCDDDKCCLT